MKSRTLRAFTLATGMLAMSFWGLNSAYGQTDAETDVASNIASVGCYNPVVLDCGFGLGQELRCNFTGSYRAPYVCEQKGCYGKELKRHCVAPQ